MLPDLWRMADRRVRPGRAEVSRAVGSPLVELLLGIEHHLAVDRWFHADAVFVDGEREANVCLRAAGMRARHPGLFAHVLWELCLDGELVRRLGRDVVVASVRAGVLGAGDGVTEAADLHYFSRVPRGADTQLAFARRLAQISGALAAGPWIDGYQTGDGIASRIQPLRARVGLESMDVEDERRLAGVAGALLERARDGVDRILSTATFAARW